MHLWDRPEDSWRRWGDLDPYFAVLSTDPKFRKCNFDDVNRTAFRDSGEKSIAEIIDHCAIHWPGMGRDRALDFGCGAGRLVIPLARRFKSVTGVDISPDMRRLTKEYAAETGVTGVSTIETPEQAEGVFDFVHSLMVFQHIPPERGYKLLATLIDKIAPGGVAALQVPLDDRRSLPVRYLNVMRRFTPFNAVTNIARNRSWKEPLMRMYRYDLGRMCLLAHHKGIDTLRIWTFENERFPYAYVFFVR